MAGGADRLTRVNERLLRELSMGLYRVGQGTGVNLARVSLLKVDVSPDLHQAYVTVSILGDEAEAAQLMRWLADNRKALQAHIAKTVGLKYTPVLTFKRTGAIEQGTEVLRILDELEEER